MKTCGKCGVTRDDSDFWVRRYKSGRIGLQPQCKQCCAVSRSSLTNRGYFREYNLVKKYGMTLEMFEEKLASQGGRCAICRTDNPLSHNWHVDHDHRSGAVRGIVCLHCNTRVLRVVEDTETLQAALAYLSTYAPTKEKA